MAGSVQPTASGRPLHSENHRQANGGTAGRAGRRRMDLRGPIEHAVRFGTGPKRRRGSQERQLSANALLQRRGARRLFARGCSSRGTLESHHPGGPRRPGRRAFRGGLFLRQEAAPIPQRAHRVDSGRCGRRSRRDLRQHRSPAPVGRLRRAHRVFRASQAEGRP